MKRLIVAGLSAGLVLPLTGCANNQEAGTGAGALLGALVGSQFGGGDGKVLATVAGGVAGGFVGNQVGAAMDKVDGKANGHSSSDSVSQSPEWMEVVRTIPLHHSQSWTDPTIGAHYTVKNTHESFNKDKRCKKVSTTVRQDGGIKTETHIVCHGNSDGSKVSIKAGIDG